MAVKAVGVGNVEHIAQAQLVVGVVDQRDTFGVFIYPAPKPLVPQFQFRAGSRRGFLRVDQHLIVKSIFIVPAGCFQKVQPVSALVGKPLCGLFRQRQYEFQR
ncbi:MAG: hypothetical protein IJD91_08205 [Clostridia bacterium]|nr:hypothetical protein [Clostridia bacterium]